MAGFNIPIPAVSPVEAEAKDKLPAATEFVAANSNAIPQPWRTPIDGKVWKKQEKSQINLFISPPQRQGITVAAKLNHMGIQEYLATVIERAVLADLEKYAKSEVGGCFAHEAAQAREYLLAWGDIAAGRNSPGRAPAW